MKKSILVYLELLRVRQWVKNGFILAPVIFSGKLYSVPDLVSVMSVFGIFCLLSSSVYILNDLNDLAADKIHPNKKRRPLASGAIKTPEATSIAMVLLCLSLILGYPMGRKILLVILLYLALHILYSLILKKTVILDVISIALGFELRVWAGSLAIAVLPSIWLQLCIFILAVFLGFIKRRHEKLVLYDKAVEHRGVLVHYTPYFLDQIITISATSSIIFYGLYVLSEDVMKRVSNYHMAYTIPFVIYGIFRYLYLVHVKKLGGEPGEILTSDFPFVLNMLLWVLAVVLILYRFK